MLYLIIFIIIIVLLILLIINLHPAFGGKLTKEQKRDFKKYDQFVDGKFINQEITRANIRLSEFPSMMKDFIRGGNDRTPNEALSVAAIDWNKIMSEEDSVTWFGHSAFLVSLDNKKIFVDPMLSLRASPVSFVGSKRYTGSMLDVIIDLPDIDAVFITHDHYDHLDYSSITMLKNKTAHFFVPLGVSNHLIRWGIPKEKITELNWWDETDFEGLKVVFTPSRHFSGRGIFNRNTTLWGGWVILGKKTRFYTSGDGGYGQHFKTIVDKYGPFDMALIEGGQYDRRWPMIHMTPEKAIQANEDIKGKSMMLIHWGAYTLANHGWTEPIERAICAATKADNNLIVPQIGETVSLEEGEFATAILPWWHR
ncbi:MBL fold metallo-hydrolase [Bacillus sp. S/N-304-OC-R1]|uniref:MBL fold metallo-hydrolase n=1 Tax=Bacillus sp. S/N-304-OC-R1 TaxID=2758034 RepID=UPI001C8E582B|nr:MBL fold metallo-hydrolase [Bacillus sp. S/N-304-OC-R1]MBY0121747.1 MBL fold metallo-hydrolase [Bacillus sp. S/N-304-OC-R1]